MVYIPKRLVETNPDVYAEAQLEDIEECEHLSEENIYGFTEPMMVCFVSNQIIINPTTGEGEGWIRDIYAFHHIRAEDAHDSSTWSDG